MPAITASALRLWPGFASTRIPTPAVIVPATMASRQSESASNRLLGGASAAISAIVARGAGLWHHLDGVSLLEVVHRRGTCLRDHRAKRGACHDIARVMHARVHARVPDEHCEHAQRRPGSGKRLTHGRGERKSGCAVA